MAIVTRCPACDTVFRVAPPQLQARNGMVRCGRCLTVFNGFKTLSTAPEPTASEAPAAEPAETTTAAPGSSAPAAAEPVSTAPESTASGISAPASATPAATPAPSTEPAFRLEPVSATELAAAAAASASGAIQPARSYGVEETKDFGPAPEQLTLEDHLFLEDTRAAQARGARLWAAGSVLVLLVLVAQAGYFYRGEISARFPVLRPQLMRLCETMGCVINLPQLPESIKIEASDLQATDARPGVIQLTATVRNHAGYDLGLPALDLVLTNSRDHTLARRIFQPREYLEPGRDARAGIPAKGEMTISLDLDTADLQPSGFRLELMAAQLP